MKKLIAAVVSVIICAVFLIGILYFTGVGKLTEERTTKLSKEYVEYKAKQYVSKKGRNLNEYSVKSVKYIPSRKEWFIYFEGRLLTIGNHFSVHIKDQTEEIQLIPGR